MTVANAPGMSGSGGAERNSIAQVAHERQRARQGEMLGAVDVGLWYCDLPFDELIWDAKVKEHFWLPPDAHVTIDTFYERIHPEDRERTRNAIARSIANHSPYDIEYRTVAPVDAANAGAVRWVRAIGYTGYDGGTPIRFDGITVDVSAQKQAAEALAQSEQRYEYASRATNNAIWDWDLKTNGASWSRGIEAAFGHVYEEVGATGAWWFENIHPDDRERVSDSIHTAIDVQGGPHAWIDEYRFRRANGEYAWVVDRGYIARDGDGVAYRMIGAMEDVTDRKRMDGELRESRAAAEEANRAKSLFLARMSHDLRTPLNAIGGYAQLMEMEVQGPVTEAQRNSLARIQRAQAHLLALINEILSFAKLEAGQLQVTLEPVGVADVIDTLQSLVQPDADRRGLTLHLPVDARDVQVIADRERLMQVLLNLTSNAIKFTNAGSVSLAVDVATEHVMIRVRDTGRGIAADRLEHIFEPFVQGQTVISEHEPGGVGLGLAISRELTRLMHGEIRAESEVGIGSTFTVQLPRSTG